MAKGGHKSRHYRHESDALLVAYNDALTRSTPPSTPASAALTEGLGSLAEESGLGGLKSRHYYRRESDALLVAYNDALNSSASGRSCPLLRSRGDAAGDDDCYGTLGTPSPRNGSFVRTSPPKMDQTKTKSPSPPEADQTKTKEKRRKGYRVHRVSYTAQNHVQILFRRYASAIPHVTPFVCVNVLWSFCIYYLKSRGFLDLTFHSSVGHSFMGLLVSFLIVNRSQISYNRFMQYRGHLEECYRNTRELAQYATVYTFQTQTPDAAWWRQELCYRAILLLRVTMDALLWSATDRDRWEDEYFKFDPERDGCKVEFESRISKHFYLIKQLSHGRRSYIDENFRSPINFSHVLRQVIMEHPYYLGYKMAVNEYRDLLGFVEKFTQAFHGFRILVFTPYPFPLLQMSRAFLFFWVYTLPLVLLKDYRLWSVVLIVVMVSFGYIGVEYVSMSLDDPLSDDTNDIDEHGMSLLVYEDLYLAIYRTDGPDAAARLRNRVLDRYRQGRELDCYRDDLKERELWEIPEWWCEEKQCNDSHEARCNESSTPHT